jgi:ribose transport system substrate-binding protein
MQDSKKWLTLLVALVALGALVAGCGGSDDSSSSAETSAESTGESDSGGETVSVYYLLPSLQNEAYTSQKAGAEAEAAKLGDVDLTVDAGSAQNGSPEELVSKLESALIKEPQAVIVNSGAAPEQLKPGLEKAIADGVEVITVDVDIPDLEGKTTYVGLDDSQASATAGEYLNEQFPKGGDVGIVSCYVDNPVTLARTEGFEAGIEKGNLKITTVVDPLCDPEKSRTMTEDMITRNPDLTAIWSSTDLGALGAIKAVQASGKDIPVLGHDGEKVALESIQNGEIAGTVWNPFDQYGEEAVRAAVESVQGGSVEPEILLTSELITKDNVAEFLGG